MIPINQAEWEVLFCNIGVEWFWTARTNENCGIDWFSQNTTIPEKSKKFCKINWEEFAKINGISKWRYV